PLMNSPLPGRLFGFLARLTLITGILTAVAAPAKGQADDVAKLKRQLEAARQEAEAYKKEAEAQRRRAEAARHEAAKQRERAEANFKLALRAVEECLKQVNQGLEKGAEMEPLRQQLLEGALKHYASITQEQGDDPRMQGEVARAHLRLAEVSRQTGAQAEALKTCQQALTLLEKLVNAHPDSPAYRSDLARGLDLLGMLHQASGKTETAEQALRKALGVRKELAAAHPKVASYQGDLAESCRHLAVVYQATGRLAEAEQ